MDAAPYLLRLALYLLLMLLFGRALYARSARSPAGVAMIVLALLLVLVDAVARLCQVLGIELRQLDADSVRWYLLALPVGAATLVRGAVLLALLGLQAVPRLPSMPRRLAMGLLAAIALASLAWNGHAAAGEGLRGQLRLGAGIAHLLAAGAWLGAIAALLQQALRPQGPSLRTRGRHLLDALQGFAVPGTLIVTTLALTGSYAYLDLGGSPTTLVATAHGRWLLLKLALVAGMLVLAALHRWRLVPALQQAVRVAWQPTPIQHLRRSLAAEAVLALLVLACVAVLGTLDPLH